jgi:hypothetical protein
VTDVLSAGPSEACQPRIFAMDALEQATTPSISMSDSNLANLTEVTGIDQHYCNVLVLVSAPGDFFDGFCLLLP